MAKANKKTGNNNVTKKTTSTYEQGKMTSVGTLNRPADAGRSNTNHVPTHKQIEDRAREIWHRKGCPSGQDEQNWVEAEAQLKKEMGIK